MGYKKVEKEIWKMVVGNIICVRRGLGGGSWYRKKTKGDLMVPNLQQDEWMPRAGPQAKVASQSVLNAVLFVDRMLEGELLRRSKAKKKETKYCVKILKRAGEKFENLICRKDTWVGEV